VTEPPPGTDTVLRAGMPSRAMATSSPSDRRSSCSLIGGSLLTWTHRVRVSADVANARNMPVARQARHDGTTALPARRAATISAIATSTTRAGEAVPRRSSDLLRPGHPATPNGEEAAVNTPCWPPTRGKRRVTMPHFVPVPWTRG